MNVLDLFSGIGGFSLGLERAGMRTLAFCEINPYCQALLAERWPHVPCYGDIRELREPPSCDVICGGFPCQDISDAGRQEGLAGTRSGLWTEYCRLIRQIRPQYAIMENVSALLHRGLGEVLGDLAEIGYDAEWHCIQAADVGAPHRRDRVWIVAYPNSEGLEGGLGRPEPRLQSLHQFLALHAEAAFPHELPESALCGGRHGISARVDRTHGLGNAVVPQIAEAIGRAIMQQVSASG